ATAGHLVGHLARRMLSAGPARDVQAAGAARIVALRFGLQPPAAPPPGPGHWPDVTDPAALDQAVIGSATAAIGAADALTARLRRALDQRPASARPTPVRPAPPTPPTRAARVPAQRRPAPPAVPSDTAHLAVLYAANAAAAAFYAARLPASRSAAAYLRSRGIGAAADPDGGWQLGVAPPGNDTLLRHLRSLGFSEQVMLDAGLVAASRLHGGGRYDLFRDRLMFPIHTPDGQIAGFTGRDLSGQPTRAKFFNTPATPVFRKGELLYGLAPQVRRLGAPAQFVVVEGPTDTIAAQLAYRGLAGDGVTSIAVAPCGTAFTAAQFGLLAAHARPDTSLIMSFDADSAGVKALNRAYPLAVTWPHGRVLGTAPAGHKDIAALLHDRGPDDALLDLLAAERPLPLLAVEHALARAFPDGFHADWPEARVRAYRTVAPYLIDAVRHGDVDLLLQSAAAQLSLAPHELSEGVIQHFGPAGRTAQPRPAARIASRSRTA
ncbi:toprim domain-containing protein, partial [Catellatospora methionotrophica]|uniref:toprim domain-containing protein n=1 Tax=Catellatospora methionotrophica TaxID=121620 RepID=UPI0033D477E7